MTSLATNREDMQFKGNEYTTPTWWQASWNHGADSRHGSVQNALFYSITTGAFVLEFHERQTCAINLGSHIRATHGSIVPPWQVTMHMAHGHSGYQWSRFFPPCTDDNGQQHVKLYGAGHKPGVYQQHDKRTRTLITHIRYHLPPRQNMQEYSLTTAEEHWSVEVGNINRL